MPPRGSCTTPLQGALPRGELGALRARLPVPEAAHAPRECHANLRGVAHAPEHCLRANFERFLCFVCSVLGAGLVIMI